MFSPFSCATFTHQEEDDDDQPMIANHQAAFSLPRRSSRSKSTSLYRRHNKENKNPYSDCGLDKFSALVADLEEKRQKIYAQPDAKGISFVRFVYKDATDTSAPVPIVVKLKDKKEDKTKTTTDHEEKHVIRNSEALVTNTDQASIAEKKVKQPKLESEKRSKQMILSYWNLKSDKRRRPSYYLPLVIIFILVLLALFGRSFAILCTCIVWYAIPTLKESSSNTRRGSKKQDYKMVITEGLMSSPKSNSIMSNHGHQRSL